MVRDIEQRVYEFVLKRAGFPIFKKTTLTPETDLDTDLHFEDDEAQALLNAFFDEFEVEPAAFSIKTYYPDAAVSLNPFKKKVPVQVPDFTVGMLINSAKAGRWLYD